jgi:RNA polymerase primary sigma factor
MVNLDKPINEEGDTLIELIKNEDSLDPMEAMDGKAQLNLELRKIMSVLDDRERIIVEDYFGLFNTPKTLADIGKDFNLTKERVRQIKEKSLRKLRNESKDLLDYIM